MSRRRFACWPDLLRTPVGITAAVMLAAVFLLAVIAPPIWGHAALKIDVGAASQGSTAAHPLGTDALGRDVLHRTLVATRLSLFLAVIASLLGAGVGVPIGVLPALVGRRLGRLITSAISLAVAFPTLLLAIFVASIVGLGAGGAVIGIASAVAPYFARLSQTLAASVAGADYIAAARLLGIRGLSLTRRHVLPNVAEPILLTLTLTMGDALLTLAGLSFLGLGVQAPSYDWGGMLNDGFNRIYVTPIVVVGPAVAIIFAALGFNLLGEALARRAARRDWTMPRHLPAPPVLAPAADDEPVEHDGRGRVLDLRGLSVALPDGSVPVRDVSITVDPGQIVGIVGESGSGKSLTAMAIAELLPEGAQMTSERLLLFGRDVRSLGKAERRRLLGRSLSIVYQDPTASLNPALRVGRQLGEVAEVHEGLSRDEARRRSIERLRLMRIGSPARRIRNYPYELSGGMRQRVMIAMGLMGTPQLIIADEPTTALDVTVQQQILKLLAEVSTSTGAAAMLISHDIAVVSQLCGRVLVMYAGRVVEELDVTTLLRQAAHPYTAALLAAVPTMDSDRERPLVSIPGRASGPFDHSPGCPFAPRCPAASDRCERQLPALSPLTNGHRVACWHPNSVTAAAWLRRGRRFRTGRRASVTSVETRGLTVRFGRGRSTLVAVDGADLTVPEKTIVGLVGESGSGKSTLARAIAGLVPIAAGEVLVNGVAARNGRTGYVGRPNRRVQLVFQDPFSSLNPRMTVGAAITEAASAGGCASRAVRTREVEELLELVHLDPAVMRELPSRLSGGQRQRVALVRALAVRPEVLIADEITSALDVSVQSDVLNLLRDLRDRLGISILFVSHNLATVRYISDTLAVMYLGRLVEAGPAAALMAEPQHPYTRSLLDAVPRLGVSIRAVGTSALDAAEPPDPRHPPSGCHLHPRCPVGPMVDPTREICIRVDPREGADERLHRAACHFALSAPISTSPSASS